MPKFTVKKYVGETEEFGKFRLFDIYEGDYDSDKLGRSVLFAGENDNDMVQLLIIWEASWAFCFNNANWDFYCFDPTINPEDIFNEAALWYKNCKTTIPANEAPYEAWECDSENGVFEVVGNN